MPGKIPDHVLDYDLAMRAVDAVLPSSHPAHAAAARTVRHCETMTGARSYSKSLAKFLRYLASRSVDPVRPSRDDIDSWFGSLNGLKPATRRKDLAVARTFYKELSADNLCDRDPTWHLRVKGGQAPYRRSLTVDESRQLLARVRRQFVGGTNALVARRDNVILTLGLMMGPRSAEMRKLVYDDVLTTEGGGEILFLRKGQREDVLPVAPAVVEAIRELRSALEELGVKVRGSDFIIARLDNTALATLKASPGTPLRPVGASTIYRVVRTGIEALQIGVARKGSHQLRKSCATLAWQGKADPADIQALLGHLRLTTTVTHYIAPAERLANPAWRAIDLR